MSKKSLKRGGFTLVEVLIVVVIMAILAATIIPQFSNSTNDAKVNSSTFNLHTLRSQIELYKSQHDGKIPSATLAELTSKTNSAGTIGTTTAFPYGPYITTIPNNGMNNLNTVGATTSNPPTAGTGTNGWLYNSTTGGIWIDDATLFSK